MASSSHSDGAGRKGSVKSRAPRKSPAASKESAPLTKKTAGPAASKKKRADGNTAVIAVKRAGGLPRKAKSSRASLAAASLPEPEASTDQTLVPSFDMVTLVPSFDMVTMDGVEASALADRVQETFSIDTPSFVIEPSPLTVAATDWAAPEGEPCLPETNDADTTLLDVSAEATLLDVTAEAVALEVSADAIVDVSAEVAVVNVSAEPTTAPLPPPPPMVETTTAFDFPATNAAQTMNAPAAPLGSVGWLLSKLRRWTGLGPRAMP